MDVIIYKDVKGRWHGTVTMTVLRETLDGQRVPFERVAYGCVRSSKAAVEACIQARMAKRDLPQ